MCDYPPALNRFGSEGVDPNPVLPEVCDEGEVEGDVAGECSYSGQVRLVARMTSCPKGKVPQASLHGMR